MYLQALDAKATIVVDTPPSSATARADEAAAHSISKGTKLGKVTVKNSTFTGNTSTGSGGGALYHEDRPAHRGSHRLRPQLHDRSLAEQSPTTATSLKITNSHFDRNTAGGEGGALNTSAAELP